MRRALRWALMSALGLFVLVGSFSLTLLIPNRSGPAEEGAITTAPAATVAQAVTHKFAELNRAIAQINLGISWRIPADVERFAQFVGLKKGTPYVGAPRTGGLVGNIGRISRDSAGVIHFVGYAFDTDVTGDPVTVWLIMDGLAIAKAQSRGGRQDITKGYGLS